MSERFVALYQAWIIERPKLVLTAIAVLAIIAAMGLPNFKLDASADSLTLENDTDLDYFRETSQRYQSGDVLIVTYKPNQELFSDQSLDRLRSFRDDLTRVEGVTSVNSILDLPLLYSPKRSLSEIKTDVRTLSTEGVDRNLVRQEFLQSPIYRDMVLGPDQQTTVLLLNLDLDQRFNELVRERDGLRLKRSREGLTEDEQQHLTAVSKTFLDYRTVASAKAYARVAEVRSIMDSYRGEAELFLGGVSMITNDMIEFIRSDLMVFGAAIILFIIGLLAVIFRQARWVVLPFSVCVLSVLFMLGWLSWIDWRLTVISSNFVALLLIIALAITIHLVVRYREYHREYPEWSQEQLVMATVRYMVRPCLYTALTTIVAFVSLVVSDIRPVIDFGWMMTIGLSVAFILAFVLLPAGMMLLPEGEPKDKGDNSAAFTLRFSRITEKYGAAVLIGSVLVGILSVYGISRLEVENRFIDYFKDTTEIYQGLSVIDQRLGGTTPLDIIIDVSEEDLAYDSGFDAEDDPFSDDFESESGLSDDDPFAEDEDPFADGVDSSSESNATSSYWFTLAGLRDLEELHNYLESLDEVGKVQSLATLYKVGRDINGGSLNDFELAFLRKGLPADIDNVLISPYLDEASNQARISLRTVESSPELERMKLPGKIRDFAVNELGFKPEQIQFTGMLVLYNNMLSSLFKSQILTLGAVFLGIMLMFMVLFRSVVIAVIAIIPNMLAASAVLGTMGLAGIPLDMMTITIAAITVGIGVDDTIHYIHRFKTEFAKDGNYIAAMHRAHGSIGRAMYYTSVIIVVGFSVLALSNFIPSIYFGLLTGFAMFSALMGALLLLPKLIITVKPFGAGAGVETK